MDTSSYMLPVKGNNCSASTDFRCFRDLPEIIYHSLVEIIFLTPNNLPLEVNCSEHCGCTTGVTYCSSYSENLNFCDLNELHAHAHLSAIATDYGLVRGWEGLCIYYSGCLQSELLVLMLDDCCKPGRWIFRLNILCSNLIRPPRGGVRLAYPISSFFKHVVLLLSPEAVSVGTPKTVLASSIWNRTTMLEGVNSSYSCMVKLENIYLRSFRLTYFKKPVLSSGLEILSDLARQGATKSVATTQVIADSTEISVEDRQEVEESKEETEDMTMNTATEDLFLGQDYMANGGELMYPLLEKALPASGNFSVNCSCSGLLYKLPENLLVDIFCRLEDKTLIRLKCICKSWNKLINDTCVPKISAFAPLHGFLYTARTINSEEFIEFVPGSCPPAPTTNSLGFVESLFALLPFQPFSEDLLDCCNGLLLFKSEAFEEYYVCNPMTRQCVAIPRNIRRQKPTYAALAFNPSESTHYKVCCFEHSGQGRTRHLSLEIFSSETGDWTYYEMPHKLYKRGDIWVKRCVYLDGKLYRLTFSKLLLCFDLREVNAHAIDIPEKDRCDHWGFVGTSKGRLYYSNGGGSQFSVWMLEGCLNANRWILMRNITINIWDEFPLGRYLSKYKRHHLFKPYAIHPSSEVIFLGTPEMIVSLDLNLRLSLQVCRLQSGKVIASGPFTVFPYTCCMVNLVDFNRRGWGSIHHGSLFKGAENLEEIVMKHSPLQEVANSSETFKKERMFEEQLATEIENDDKELENTTESCIPRKDHFVEEREDAKAASDGVLVMEGNSSRADTCCNIQYKLSYDLLAEILCYLPDKSLGRLKCVCKSWDDVITNVCIPKIAASTLCGFLYFATVNLGFKDPRLFLGYVPHAKPPAPTVDLGFLETFCPLLPFDAYSDDLLDCCNGLFLFRNHSLQYFVCNPMTKESVVIPKGLSRKRSSYAALAFDPCRSLHYKIVCFNRTLSSLLCLEIFSSETGKWTAHEVPVQHSIQGSEWIRRCANLEGVLYRLSRSKHLLRFDLNTVSVRAIELPGNATIKNLGNIGASGGRLYYSIHDSSRLFVWVLEDRVRFKVDRWILVHNAGISDLAKQELSSKLPNYILSSTFKVYGMHPASRAIFFGTTGAIIRYDIDDKRLEVGHRLEITQPAIEDAYSVFLYTCCMMNLENF